ncbi:Protein PTI1 [Nakaseomyces bracarensis]|uniref:Protein PTI1 n=1 Tax=Nakaseomyces bracarensis TaxID=273131 RepID=A0ABR4NTB8_9SACH
MSDPRTRNTRHMLTPDNLSTSILVTNLPSGWNQDVVSSIIAGSGPVVQINKRTDPRTGKINGLVYEYKEASDCKRAYDLLQRVGKLPVQLERIIPSNSNYKERDVSDKPEIPLDREHYPWSAQLELPFEMISEVPLPKKASVSSNTNNNNNSSNGGSSSNSNSSNSMNGVVVFPEILAKSSQKLPKLEPEALNSTDAISTNLAKIAPPQLIEVITNLKMLANQGNTQRTQLETFLKSSNDIIISMTQAMLEMGFIDYDIVTQVMKDVTMGGSSSNETSNRGTPTIPQYNNITPTMPMVGMVPPPMNVMPPMQFMPQQHFGFPPPVQAPQVQSPPQRQVNMVKLQQLPENQRDMVKQVLKLTDEQIAALPEQQQTMVTNLRKEYLY